MESLSGDRPGWRRFISGGTLWTAIWALLAVLHVTQAIWISGGKASPGDLGDGRFNELVLEHGYRSLTGTYPWGSPSQFFPQQHTLTFSDTHAGTIPIYAVFRLAGFPIERAWQGWFVIVALLNTIAVFRLFGALGIAHGIRGPLVFAASASAVVVWLAGTHMQMLPFFPVVLAWDQLVRWAQSRGLLRLFAAGGWLAWQFAAGPYLGFFAVALTLAMACIHLGFRFACGPAIPGSTLPAPPASKTLSIAVAIIGTALGLAAAQVYLRSSSMGVARSMAEVVALAPSLSAWVTAPPTHVWWRAGWPGGQANLVELAWLAGFIPLFLLPVALVVGWKHRQDPSRRWMLAAAAGGLLTLFFFTKWGHDGGGAWLVVAEKFPALRAFRSAGRIAPLLFLLFVAAAGLLLTGWQTGGGRLRRYAALTLALLIAGETLGHLQPHMDLALARARADSVITAWRAAGDRPVLAYAFSYANQPAAWLHLDAWNAALRLGRATINGYTGGVPSMSWSFIVNPTPRNARALIAATGLDPDRVSLIESVGPAAEAAIGLRRFGTQPVIGLEGFRLQPRRWSLFSPLESYEIHGTTMYQFTPPAEIVFDLPDNATVIEYIQAMRDGSYDHEGHSDGVGITWTVLLPGQPETVAWREYFNPRDEPAHRGLVSRRFGLPSGTGRVLILRTDPGPANDGRWDWPLFGGMKFY